MKIATAALIFLTAAGFCATPDWVTRLTPPTPGYFPMLSPVRFAYKMGWMGIPAGEATARFHPGTDGRVRLDIEGRSTGAARAIWRFDATHKAEADAATLMPRTVHQVEEYGYKTLTTDLEFEPGVVRNFRYNKPYDPKPPPRKRIKIPMVRDMHTAILFVRSQRCAPGDSYTMPVYPGSSGYLVTVLVRKRETVAVKAGTFDAIKCELKIQKITKKRELVPISTCKRAYVWFSNDEHRYPLKILAEVFVGNIWVELQNVQHLKK